MTETPNHGFNIPDEGDENWHKPLNENFEAIDIGVPIRDEGSPMGDYEPLEGARYVDEELGVVWEADGTDWDPVHIQGIIDGDSVGFVSQDVTEFYLSGTRALRLEDNGGPPNVIGGAPTNETATDSTVAATIGGGVDNSVVLSAGTVGGGAGNAAEGEFATVGGGEENIAGGDHATVGGGDGNIAMGNQSTIAGGNDNVVDGQYASVCAGNSNQATGRGTTVAGGTSNDAHGSRATIGGGMGNEIADLDPDTVQKATIGGGENNYAEGNYSVIGGGGGEEEDEGNSAVTSHSTVSGGQENVAGDEEDSETTHATVGGGNGNTASGEISTVAGGRANDATEEATTVGGGRDNDATGDFATIPGGLGNEASGRHSFAAGRRATASHDGSFVWSDSTSGGMGSISSTGEDQFLIEASGGVGIGTDDPQQELHVRPDSGSIAMVLQNSGDGDGTDDGGWGIGTGEDSDNLNFYWNDDMSSVWPVTARITTDGEFTSVSDRRLKTDIEGLDGVLDDVLSLRPTRFRHRQSSREALGFIAQEVREVFPEIIREEQSTAATTEEAAGSDDGIDDDGDQAQSVTSDDEDGGLLSLAYDQFTAVAVRAIQEQQAIIDRQRERVDELESRNEEMERRLATLESQVGTQPVSADD